MKLGEKIRSVAEAQKKIKKFIKPGVIVFASSYNPDFPLFDVILAWKVGNKIEWRGLQMKFKKGLPTVPKNTLGILLRGDAPQKGRGPRNGLGGTM